MFTKERYDSAKKIYENIGVNVNEALETLKNIRISSLKEPFEKNKSLFYIYIPPLKKI